MPKNTRPLRRIRQYWLSDQLRDKRYFKETFSGAMPVILRNASSVTALPTAAQGQINQIITPFGNYVELFQTTAQTILPVGADAHGLDISCDAVDNETVELVPGGNTATNPFSFVVGTDPDWFFKVTVESTDADGSDQFLIGFRKQEGYQVPTSFLTTGDGIYVDFAGIGFASVVTNPNLVVNATDKGNAGSTIVSSKGFTVADGTINSFEVRVVGGKLVTLVNGVQSGSVAVNGLGTAITAQTVLPDQNYTFTSGLRLIPFLVLRHDANVANGTYIYSWEGGPLVEVGKDPNQE